ncbi:MAG: ribonuclease III [Chthoniobacterales bacterium]
MELSAQILPISPALMNPLEERIGYKFRNSLLLAEAMTHSSISLERKNYPFDNQRLEFLGDAVLQVIITDHLFRIFPDFTEGQLTKLRSRLVSRSGLRAYASVLKLGDFLMMGRGEESSGGRDRASTLADSFEALVGAIYLDGGLESARKFVLTQTQEEIYNLTQHPAELNPKGQLQEILQAVSTAPPYYKITAQSGPDHQKQFECVVIWEETVLGNGNGRSKKTAEVEAATDALKNQAWQKAIKLGKRPSAK